jgi:hypothetical protein
MKLLQAEADALLPTREALFKSHDQVKKIALVGLSLIYLLVSADGARNTTPSRSNS